MPRHILHARSLLVRWPSSACRPRWLLFGALAALVSYSALGCTAKEAAQLGNRSESAEIIESARTPTDLDADGVDDAVEDALAERFAPIVFHGERETTFPTNVDKWLTLTDLYFVDEDGMA